MPGLSHFVLFHGPPIATAIAICLAASWPGVHFGLMVAAFFLFGISAILWLILAFRTLNQRTKHRLFHLGLAPLLAAASLTVLFSGWATQVRFVADRPSFDASIKSLEPVGNLNDQIPLDVPERIGTQPVARAAQAGEAVIFHSTDGGLTGHAGYAYLPDGPDQRVIATVDKPIEPTASFQSLGGGWYVFRASW